MPAKSKAQFRFMKAVESGKIKVKGLSKKEAAEFTKGMTSSDYKKLKERKGGKK